jgi:hypothetical protein
MVDDTRTDGTGTEAEGSQSASDPSVVALVDSFERESEQPVTPPAEPTSQDEALKALQGLDFDKLPQSIKDKLEHPFKADYTRKMQALSEERRRYEDLMGKFADNIGRRPDGQPPAPDAAQKIKEAVERGDFETAFEIQRQTQADLVNKAISPVATEVARRNAVEEARRMEPLVQTYEGEVAAMIQADPQLLALANADGYRYAPQVFRGAAVAIHAQKLAAQLKEAVSSREAYAKQVLKEYIERAKGLPATTSRAGSTQTGTGKSTELTMRQAMEQASQETGLERVLSNRG